MTTMKLLATSVAAATTAYATQVTSTAAALVLAANAPSDGLAHKVSLTSAGGVDLSGVAFTVAGKDADGNAQTESIAAGPNGSTVTSAKFYASGVSVTPGSTMATKLMDVGIAAASVSASQYPSADGRNAQFNIGIGTRVLSGSPTFSIQHSYDGVQWFEHSVITGKTSATDGVYTSPVAAIRLAFTVAGSVLATAIQFGNVGYR